MNNNTKNIIITLTFDMLIIALAILSVYAMIEKAQIKLIKNYDLRITQTGIDSNSIYAGDRIISFNGFRLTQTSQTNDRLDPELIIDKYKAGDKVSIIVSRYGHEKMINTELVHYYDTGYFIVLILVSLIFLITQFIVLFKIEEKKLGQVFHWLLSVIVVKLLYSWGSLAVFGSGLFGDTLNIMLRSLNDISFILIPVTFIHFSFLVPKKKWENEDKFFNWVYILSGIIFIPILWLNFEYITRTSFETILWDENAHSYFFRPLLAPCFVFIIANFIHSYYKSNIDSEKRKLLWILTGLLLGPAFYVFLYILPEEILGHTLISETLMILLLVISPITLFIAIFRYQFLDIQIIIKRSFVYGFVFSLLIAVYTGVVVLLTQFIKLNTEQLYHIPDSIAAIIIVILFLPVRNYVQAFVDRKFFKVSYDFKIVQQQFLSEINNCISLKEISEILIKTINLNIPAESINFFSYTESNDDLEILAEDNNPLDQNLIYQIKEICRQNESKLPIAKKRALMDDIGYIEKSELLKSIKSEIIFMSFTENRILINILVLGKKKSGLSYTSDDISILRYFTAASGNAFQKLELQRELLFHQEEINKLEELNKLKSYFVSSVSHELKTPLTSIKLFAEIIKLKDNISLEQRKDYLEIIKGECERLNRLVDNILDFGKIERGSKEYKFEIVNLNNIVDSAINTLNYLLKLKKFNLIYTKNEDEYNINGDADALMEVFINMIDNSIKYSMDTKEILIKTYQDDNKYCFQISDKGIGIDDSEQEKIFESFYRSNETNVKSTGGAGIGLSLVRQIVNSHKGYIELESKIGHGSIFRLYFPKSE